jgi:aspartyl-tRNA(Asn)/glutamyl-tRNA(Gln) amidotransferase subunit C
MSLSPQDVSRIAHLARLELSPAEGAAMQSQLNDFFKIVDQMSAVDTSGLEPLHTPLSAIGEVELRLRPDVVTEPNERERNMANAPLAEDGLFLVPRVIE